MRPATASGSSRSAAAIMVHTLIEAVHNEAVERLELRNHTSESEHQRRQVHKQLQPQQRHQQHVLFRSSCIPLSVCACVCVCVCACL